MILKGVKKAKVIESKEAFYMIILRDGCIENFSSPDLKKWTLQSVIDREAIDAEILEFASKKRFFVISFSGKDVSIYCFSRGT